MRNRTGCRRITTQLALRIEVAQRTSPTNIGLWLTSALAAADFGYLTGRPVSERCREDHSDPGASWNDMRGIYSTGTTPRRCSRCCRVTSLPWTAGISSPRSGCLNQGCGDLLARPVIGHACLLGLQDTVRILHESYGNDPSIAAPARRICVTWCSGPTHGHS